MFLIFFKHIIGYDSGFGSKPDPDICLAFCSKSGLQPESVLMVGDSLHDMQAGRSAGMNTVGVFKWSYNRGYFGTAIGRNSTRHQPSTRLALCSQEG